jgi:hypothetical protein
MANVEQQLRSWMPLAQASEAESFSSVPEQHVKRRLIQAQSTAIARAMASICNDEQGSFGVMSGHDRNTLSLSARLMRIQHRRGLQPISLVREIRNPLVDLSMLTEDGKVRR